MSPFGGGGLALGGGIGAAGAAFGVGDQTGFASHAARSSFQHGGQMQQQQQHLHQQSHSLGGERGPRAGGAGKARIRDVWKHNLNEEMAVLMELVQDYPYIAMVRNGAFPRVVHLPRLLR